MTLTHVNHHGDEDDETKPRIKRRDEIDDSDKNIGDRGKDIEQKIAE